MEEHRQIGVVVEAVLERRKGEVHDDAVLHQAGRRQLDALRRAGSVDVAVLEQVHEGHGVVGAIQLVQCPLGGGVADPRGPPALVLDKLSREHQFDAEGVGGLAELPVTFN